ncbi:hypothetical protein GCM10011381_07220 [Klenkia taihuensis]|uniref:Diguanylate cyclase (GGDEF) domain-containing protein n=2 Tax=Klenkia taihuensis TaxID=1225127 RepID=A0A1I1QG31_9ACTN|nr:hypothetical protein GCM10011381_07220 [Klenkia taihuensis]SFD18193.1 diguanylate cyclase (GGDEF) domain-containing protein [Klenkia taihuensis]
MISSASSTGAWYDDPPEPELNTPGARGGALSAPGLVLLAVLGALALGRSLLPAGTAAEVSYLVVVTGASVSAWWAVAHSGRAGFWTAAGITLSCAGDWLWQVGAWSGAPEASVSVADAAYLGSYVAVALGLRRALAQVAQGSRFDRFVDTAAAFLLVVYLEWVLVLHRTVEDDSLPVLVRTVLAAYPVLDAWLLALVVRLCVLRSSLGAGAVWVGAGAAAWFLADLGYLVDADTSAVLDVGWTLGSLALAASVWLTGAGPRRSARRRRRLPVSRAQLTLALLPLAVPGVVEVVAWARGTDVDPLPGLLVTAAVLALAYARAYRLSRQQADLSEALELRARRAAALAVDSADALVVVDPTGRALTGPGRPAGSAVWTALGEDDPSGRAELLDRARTAPGRTVSAELCTAPGAWVEVRVVDRSDDADVGGLVVTLQDVTARRRVQDELAHQAFHDGLTGLANRALFDDRVGHTLARSGRTGTDPAVLSLDLDGFKTVNDTLGHPAGDELLRQVAARLSAQVRPADTVARLGGDEFAVLVEPGPADTGESHRALADRLVAAVGAAYDLAGRTVHVGASVGLVVADPDAGPTAASLLRDADTALYRAKSRGKGQVVVFAPDMRAELLLHTQLVADLPGALAGGQLRVAYQPVVDLGSGDLEGFEALLRWQHPTLGAVSPATFVPLAEENGLIEEIGRWVLGEACAAAAAWRAGTPGADLTIAVNLSGRQLRSPRLVGDVAAALDRTGLTPHALCLELTETALVHDAEQAARTLHELRGLGVRLAVDDFGTGFSSLTHLRQFPVDVLKIDRSFVSGVGPDVAAPPVVLGLLELARVMGLDVVAEGVESEDQRAHLRDQGCRSAQGWLFSPALERDAADARVAGAGDSWPPAPDGVTARPGSTDATPPVSASLVGGPPPGRRAAPSAGCAPW